MLLRFVTLLSLILVQEIKISLGSVEEPLERLLDFPLAHGQTTILILEQILFGLSRQMEIKIGF